MQRKLLVILLGTGLFLTACTGIPDGGGDTPKTPAATHQDATAAAPPTASGEAGSTAPGEAGSGALRDVTCTADSSGAWSFNGLLVNEQDRARTFTIAIAVTVGPDVKGHDIVTQEVPANGEFHVTRNYFAQTAEQGAVCEPVVSVEG